MRTLDRHQDGPDLDLEPWDDDQPDRRELEEQAETDHRASINYR